MSRFFFPDISVALAKTLVNSASQCSRGGRLIRHFENLDQAAQNWLSAVPHIQPHYAVKSNPSAWIIRRLSRFANIGFDCASFAEIKSVLKNVENEPDIILSNPVKRVADLVQSAPYVSFTVADTVDELQKIARHTPQFPVVIRLKVNDKDAVIKFSNKFGVDEEDVPQLVKVAMELGLCLRGVSYHIGSGGGADRGARHLAAFQSGQRVNTMLRKLGYPADIIDIGGGFCPGDNLTEMLRGVKDERFQIISEPGRYFSAETQTLMVEVLATRDLHKESGGFHIDNGTYHELNVCVHDHFHMPKLELMYDERSGEFSRVTNFIKRKMFGVTCDGEDELPATDLPVMQAGDKIVLPSMGAYTNAAATPFNGVPVSQFTREAPGEQAFRPWTVSEDGFLRKPPVEPLLLSDHEEDELPSFELVKMPLAIDRVPKRRANVQP